MMSCRPHPRAEISAPYFVKNVGNDKVSNLPHTPPVGRLETCPTLFRRRRALNLYLAAADLLGSGEIFRYPFKHRRLGRWAKRNSQIGGGQDRPQVLSH